MCSATGSPLAWSLHHEHGSSRAVIFVWVGGVTARWIHFLSSSHRIPCITSPMTWRRSPKWTFSLVGIVSCFPLGLALDGLWFASFWISLTISFYATRTIVFFLSHPSPAFQFYNIICPSICWLDLLCIFVEYGLMARTHMSRTVWALIFLQVGLYISVYDVVSTFSLHQIVDLQVDDN